MLEWEDEITVYCALSKLHGLTAVWYEGLSSARYTWEEWKEKLIRAFPSQRDFNERREFWEIFL